MGNLPTPEKFVQYFANNAAGKTKDTHELINEIRVRYATVEPGYTSGKPKVIFDGESLPTSKYYPYLSSYTPAAGDKVVLLNDLILGSIIT